MPFRRGRAAVLASTAFMNGLVYATSIPQQNTSPAPYDSKTYTTTSSSRYSTTLTSVVYSRKVFSQTLSDPFPYEFPQLHPASGAGSDGKYDPFPMPLCEGFKLEEATIDELQEAMTVGRLTAVQIAMCYMDRVYQTDDYINSIMEMNPDFIRIASALDNERRAGHVRGPLHGIPFLVKDNIATKDKMETTAGSWALLGSVVPRDAFVVSKLREAGAVLMGKATLSEWADMRSNRYSEGYSARGGQARSPYNLTLNPGGSSSGSGAAVGANVCMFALGTETDGSVISPAERNGVVGIKPTVGLTSRAGVIPESSHQDTVGVFARTVRDAAYALDAVYGADTRDNYTSAQVGKTPRGGYAHFLTTKKALKGARFGIPWNSFWVYADEHMKRSLMEVITIMQDAGAVVLNGTELPSYQTIVSPGGWDWDYGTTRGFANESEYTVVKVDFYNDIKRYLAELDNTNMKSLEDIVKFNNENDGTEGGRNGSHAAFASGQDGFLASLESKGIMDETYFQALQFCQKSTREDGIDGALRQKSGNLTALLVPADVAQTYQIAAQAGYPMVTIPAGTSTTTGMPFGLALMGTAWSDGDLVKYASAIEDAQKTSMAAREKGLMRTKPMWYEYRAKNIPVLNL